LVDTIFNPKRKLPKILVDSSFPMISDYSDLARYNSYIFELVDYQRNLGCVIHAVFYIYSTVKKTIIICDDTVKFQYISGVNILNIGGTFNADILQIRLMYMHESYECLEPIKVMALLRTLCNHTGTASTEAEAVNV
jgi:hypothetical protein